MESRPYYIVYRPETITPFSVHNPINAFGLQHGYTDVAIDRVISELHSLNFVRIVAEEGVDWRELTECGLFVRYVEKFENMDFIFLHSPTEFNYEDCYLWYRTVWNAERPDISFPEVAHHNGVMKLKAEGNSAIPAMASFELVRKYSAPPHGVAIVSSTFSANRIFELDRMEGQALRAVPEFKPEVKQPHPDDVWALTHADRNLAEHLVEVGDEVGALKFLQILVYKFEK